MPFLDRMTEAERQRLIAAAQPIQLARGAYLMRRGDPGGDLYLVQQGELEIVDTRSRPEVVLDGIGPGGLVGEMSFLDQEPRAADVRAASDVRALYWERGALNMVLMADPELSSSFFQAMSAGLIDRLRNLTASAVSGALGRQRALNTNSATTVMLARDAFAIAERARVGWIEAEGRLRREPGHPDAIRQARDAAQSLLSDVVTLANTAGGSGKLREGGQALAREMHAFLVRARTVVLAWENTGKSGIRADLVSHVIRGNPSGEGTLGQALDAAILNLPTPEALVWRAGTASMIAAAATESAARRHAQRSEAGAPARIYKAMIVNGALLGLPERYGAALEGFRGGTVRLSVIEESRDLLTRVGSGPGGLPLNIELRRVQDDLGGLVLGRSRLPHEAQDVILIDGMVEYLPERLIAGLLTWCRDLLALGGAAIVTGLTASSDAGFWEGVMGWPQVRRPPQAVASIFVGLGYADVRVQTEGAGVVVSGVRR